MPGVTAPRYPAGIAALLLLAPSWLAARRPWIWVLQGVVVLLLSAAGWLWPEFALSLVGFGTPAGPQTYPPSWLLPGGAAIAGIAATCSG